MSSVSHYCHWIVIQIGPLNCLWTSLPILPSTLHLRTFSDHLKPIPAAPVVWKKTSPPQTEAVALEASNAVAIPNCCNLRTKNNLCGHHQHFHLKLKVTMPCCLDRCLERCNTFQFYVRTTIGRSEVSEGGCFSIKSCKQRPSWKTHSAILTLNLTGKEWAMVHVLQSIAESRQSFLAFFQLFLTTYQLYSGY